MKNQDFYNYASEDIYQSIIALDYDRTALIEYYGDSNKCNIETYYSAQIKGNALYSQADEQTAETLLISDITEYAEIFEDARESAYRKWESLQF